MDLKISQRNIEFKIKITTKNPYFGAFHNIFENLSDYFLVDSKFSYNVSYVNKKGTFGE